MIKVKKCLAGSSGRIRIQVAVAARSAWGAKARHARRRSSRTPSLSGLPGIL